jgi:hypothetical protein
LPIASLTQEDQSCVLQSKCIIRKWPLSTLTTAQNNRFHLRLQRLSGIII